MILKKIITAVLTLAVIAVLTVSAAAVGHTSADQVFGADGATDLASIGNNDVTGTDLGVITDSAITLWGWYADEGKITEFGYRYGDNVVLGSPKYRGGDDAVIAGQAAALGYADGESVRFRIENIPVMKGENVELYAVAKLEDGQTVDIWRLTYSSENGQEPAQTTDPGATAPDVTPQNPQTADASVAAMMLAAAAALLGMTFIGRRKA